jgi:hypothetical protein
MESSASVRIYRASSSGAEYVEVVRLDALAPPRAVEGALDAPDVDGNAVDGAGLFLALVQGGKVVDVARLVFRVGDPRGADGPPDCYSSNPSTSEDETTPSGSRSNDADEDEVSSVASLSTFGGGLLVDSQDAHWIDLNAWEEEEEEEEEEVEGDCEAEGEDQGKLNDEGRPAHTTSSFWRLGDSDSTSSSDDEEYQVKNQEVDQDKQNSLNEKEDRDAFQPMKISLRLCPAEKHAVIRIFIKFTLLAVIMPCAFDWQKLRI